MSPNHKNVSRNIPDLIQNPQIQRTELIKSFTLNINHDAEEVNEDGKEVAPEVAADQKDQKSDIERHQDSSGAIF